MDGLMSEATDFILSAGKKPTSGSDKVLKRGTGETPDSPADSSSITLLRQSITNSIRSRSIESEVSDFNVSKSNKNKRFKETYAPRTKVKSSQLLNSELTTINSETSAVLESDQNESNFTVKAFCELLKEKDATGKDSLCIPDTQSIKMNTPQTNELSEIQKGRNKTVQNSMKLASRNFSENILENCSTYNLDCDETHQEKMTATSPEQIDIPVASKSSEKNPSDIGDVNPKDTTDHQNSSADDDMNLRDSFFVDLTSDDGVQSGKSRLEAVPDDFIQNKTFSRSSLPEENGTEYPEEILGKGIDIQQRCERRLRKKLRKRNRKSKSGNVPTYDCPKCGVSYILSAKASERTARCLHCDFWTSVEPEFLKREKLPWNTCRIC